MDVIDVDDREENALGVLVSEHPLAALGGALALGYLLGGGLATRASRHLLRRGLQLGMQLATLPQYEDELAELASRLGQTLRRAAEGAGRAPADADPDEPPEFVEENAARDL